MTRIALAALVLFALAGPALADEGRVKGYFRDDGRYVEPHYRTTPNTTINDNYGTSPNINPHTGTPGTRAPEPSFGAQPTPRWPGTQPAVPRSLGR